ncbi:hypothetical protein CYMTET_35544, partial [Cymbomonas tetramitiformis]
VWSWMVGIGLGGTAWQASPARPDIFDGPENMIVEGLPEQRIMYSFSSDVGNKWSAPFTVPQQKKKRAVWSPVLHVDNAGTLWLFYAESSSCKIAGTPSTWSPGGDILAVSLSSDQMSKGFSPSDPPQWSQPRIVYATSEGDSIPKVLANKLQVLSTGEWVLPFWRELPDESVQGSDHCKSTSWQIPSAGVLISEDGAPACGSGVSALGSGASPVSAGVRRIARTAMQVGKPQRGGGQDA